MNDTDERFMQDEHRQSTSGSTSDAQGDKARENKEQARQKAKETAS